VISIAQSPAFSIADLRVVLEQAGVRFEILISELVIQRGETVAFVGESGCGKSTLMDVLGLIAPSAEATRFDLGTEEGITDVRSLNDGTLAHLRAAHFGYMLQSGGLLPFLSVMDNVLLPSRISGMKGGDVSARDLLGKLGLHGQERKKPAFLSGGQRQRAALARALVHRPTVLIADEPTGSVDKHAAREIRDLLLEHARSSGATVLIVSHDEALLRNRTDRLFRFQVTRTASGGTLARLCEERWEAGEKQEMSS